VRQLVLTGGEPTLRSDLPELFDVIRAACPSLEHVELATNGLSTRRTLDHVERMLRMIEYSPGRIDRFVVQVSLDGIGDVHDDVRGIRGAYRHACETLDGLRQLEQRYPLLSRRLSCMVMPSNLAQVEPLQALAREQGCEAYFSPAIVSGEYYRNLQDSAELAFSPGVEHNEDAVRAFEALAATENSAIRFYYRDVSQMLQGAKRNRPCMMGFYGGVIEYDGNVYPCVNHESSSFGNLLEQSFNDVWFGPRAQAAREDLRCSGCPTCVSSCYTLPVSIAEMVKLLTLRVVRTRRVDHVPVSENAKGAQ